MIQPLKKVDDTLSRIRRLLASGETTLAESFLRVVRFIRDQQTLAQIESLIEAGRIEEALAFSTTAWQGLANDWLTVYVEAANSTASLITRELPVVVNFNQVNERAVANMQQNQFRLVQGLSQQQTAATRQALVRGITEGANPRAQARNFRASIGLTPNQEQAVANYRRALEEGQISALNRELRDRRFDRTVRARFGRGEPLTTTEVDRMVVRYRERFIKYRSEVIARSESLRAVNQGNFEMFEQAAEEGAIDRNELIRTWVPADDERTRDSHEDMRGQQRGLTEPFESGLGNLLLYPGDPSAPAEDTVKCRCVVTTRFVQPNVNV